PHTREPRTIPGEGLTPPEEQEPPGNPPHAATPKAAATGRSSPASETACRRTHPTPLQPEPDHTRQGPRCKPAARARRHTGSLAALTAPHCRSFRDAGPLRSPEAPAHRPETQEPPGGPPCPHGFGFVEHPSGRLHTAPHPTPPPHKTKKKGGPAKTGPPKKKCGSNLLSHPHHE